MGYILFQWVEEKNPAVEATIVSANSSILPPNIGFSPIDGQIASLSYAIKCCYYYILHAPKLRLYSDCKGLVEMYQKDLAKVSNPKHFRIMTEIQCITFYEVTYIPGEANILADALSRLTKHLRVEGRELQNIKPRILGLSSCRARRATS